MGDPGGVPTTPEVYLCKARRPRWRGEGGAYRTRRGIEAIRRVSPKGQGVAKAFARQRRGDVRGTRGAGDQVALVADRKRSGDSLDTSADGPWTDLRHAAASARRAIRDGSRKGRDRAYSRRAYCGRA